MDDEGGKGIALVILGIVAIIAIIGLVLLFSGAKNSAGALFTHASGSIVPCPYPTKVGEPQWTPIIAGPNENPAFKNQWAAANYECVPAAEGAADEFGYPIELCCKNPAGVPVNERGPTSLETRRDRGVPVGSGKLGERPMRIGP